MAENKDNDERKAQIAEVNKHIRDGINQWADIMLTADADQWAYHLRYFPRDLMNATLIFQHVASSIGIHAGRIDEEKATEFGQRLRQLVIDMTGYDPHEFWKDPKNFENEPQADNETLAKRIEDCNLSVRTTNICKANGIDTLGDLCKLHKTDWLKFRNGGKKSLIELDDLLHDNGLDWAEWR